MFGRVSYLTYIYSLSLVAYNLLSIESPYYLFLGAMIIGSWAYAIVEKILERR